MEILKSICSCLFYISGMLILLMFIYIIVQNIIKTFKKDKTRHFLLKELKKALKQIEEEAIKEIIEEENKENKTKTKAKKKKE